MRFLLRNPLLKSLSPVIVFSFLVSCSMIKSTSSSGPSTQKEEYKGPKARVAVTKFIDKSGKGKTTSKTGDGMSEMLGNALLATNRFNIQMRLSLDDDHKGQNQAPSRTIGIKGADLLVEGTITKFEPGTKGSGDDGGTQLSHVGLIVNVIDVKTGQRLFSEKVEGKAKGSKGTSRKSRGELAGVFSVYSKTPMEEAIRMAVEESAKVIVAKTPAEYYRVSSTSTKSPPSPPKESSKPSKTQPEVTYPPLSSTKSEPPSLRVIQVIWPFVNLREGPGTSYTIVGSIKKGTSLTLLEDKGDWLHVRLQDGKKVWVSKEATTLPQNPQPPPSRTPAPTSAPEEPKPM